MTTPAPPPAEELARLRALYEERPDVTIAAIAADNGMTASRLSRLARRQGWRRRRPPRGASFAAGPPVCTGLAACPEREATVARLLATCEAQVKAAADRLADKSADVAPEREARTLAVLARTIERLTALDKRAPPTEPDDSPLPRDFAELRAELARRLAELEGGGAGERLPGQPDG